MVLHNTYSKFCSSCAGSLAFTNAYFGQGNGAIVFDEVNCVGSEDRLDECPRNHLHHSELLLCHHREDAGVRCVGMWLLPS